MNNVPCGSSAPKPGRCVGALSPRQQAIWNSVRSKPSDIGITLFIQTKCQSLLALGCERCGLCRLPTLLDPINAVIQKARIQSKAQRMVRPTFTSENSIPLCGLAGEQVTGTDSTSSWLRKCSVSRSETTRELHSPASPSFLSRVQEFTRPSRAWQNWLSFLSQAIQVCVKTRNGARNVGGYRKQSDE